MAYLYIDYFNKKIVKKSCPLYYKFNISNMVKQGSSEVECWAHNPKVGGSIPPSVNITFLKKVLKKVNIDNPHQSKMAYLYIDYFIFISLVVSLNIVVKTNV
jgi:hypothetical protein